MNEKRKFTIFKQKIVLKASQKFLKKMRFGTKPTEILKLKKTLISSIFNRMNSRIDSIHMKKIYEFDQNCVWKKFRFGTKFANIGAKNLNKQLLTFKLTINFQAKDQPKLYLKKNSIWY